jgi:hypothetical protein
MEKTNRKGLILPEPNGFVKASEYYCKMYPLRAAIQILPGLGGAIDTFFSGAGANWQARRLEEFINLLNRKFGSFLHPIPDIDPNEPLYDFIMQVFNSVISHRSAEKRKLFANIVTRQILAQREWDDAEAAVRILSDLSELHVKILTVAVEAPKCSDRFEGLRVVTFRNDKNADKELQIPPLDLRTAFPHLSELALRMCCAELLAKGLLHDEGVGGLVTPSFLYFITTELGYWFIQWIQEPRFNQD